MLAVFSKLVKKLLLLFFGQLFVLLCEILEFREFKLLTRWQICIEVSIWWQGSLKATYLD
jgi:hypothetical protein